MEKFSNDEIVKFLSMRKFMENCSWFYSYKELPRNEPPQYGSMYFKFTEQYFICVYYGYKFGLVGIEPVLKHIYIANRDGKTEYDLMTNKLNQILSRDLSKIKPETQRIKNNLEYLIKNYDSIVPKYNDCKVTKIVQPKTFNDYLIDTKCICDFNNLGEKFVVLDVETNGLRRDFDDLLSISIYNPSTGVAYNRFLPLDQQPLVLTSYINGITDSDLENTTHITQQEFDELIKQFNLNDVTILTYCGGPGNFDAKFLTNYCKRHNLKGAKNFKYDNIKNYIPKSTFETSGLYTKDNLCRIFRIDGVTKIHTGVNDCILEWQLFEKIYGKKFCNIGLDLYEFSSDYIIPITYYLNNPCFKQLSNIELPCLDLKKELIFEYDFPKNIIKSIKKFPTNITGITIENAIYHLLNIQKENNKDFLVNNKNHLKYIGSLKSKNIVMPVSINNEGKLVSLDEQFDDEIDEINEVTSIIENNINPVTDFIKNVLFKDEQIIGQELVLYKDKLLSLCDLSSKTSVLEIKTNKFIGNIAPQLYCQKNNRETYLLWVDFVENNETLKGLSIHIYKVSLSEFEPTFDDYKLDKVEKKIIQIIKDNNSIKMVDIAKKVREPYQYIVKTINRLIYVKFIEKDGGKTNYTWKILREE